MIPKDQPAKADREQAVAEGFKILSHERAQQLADYHASLQSFWESEAKALNVKID